MAKCEKPFTANIREQANKLFFYLREQDDFVTKQQIGDYLGIKDERSVRCVISALATRKPILSRSSGCGYKLCQTEADLEEAEHTLAEMSSRVEEIQKRMQPLYAWRDKVKYNIKGEQNND